MLKLGFGFAFVLAQLTAPGNNLPQILSANFKSAAPIKAGVRANVNVTFSVLKGYAVNHTPPISLKLSPAAGVRLDKTEFTTPSPDPKAKDEYYVELPTLNVAVTAAKPGAYQIPGKITYFFCSKSDGFCSKQVFDVKIPLQVQ